jgi:hypothetical protein
MPGSGTRCRPASRSVGPVRHWRWPLSKGPDGTVVGAPRMQHMQTVADTYGKDILKATLDTERLARAGAGGDRHRKRGQSEAVSSAGAVGLMQLIPATAERFGVTDSTDPVQNIKGGVAYLDWLMKEFDNDPADGAGRLQRGRRRGARPTAACRPMPRRATMCRRCWRPGRWRRGCASASPMLVTDPCVFRTDIAGLIVRRRRRPIRGASSAGVHERAQPTLKPSARPHRPAPDQASPPGAPEAVRDRCGRR